MLRKPGKTVRQARQLRRDMSLPEVLLWQQLRLQSDVKFRRQHPLGPYVLDFYCAKAKVAVELDGIAHDMGDRPERDLARDAWLAQQSVEALRIPAADVLASPVGVAEALVRYCRR